MAEKVCTICGKQSAVGGKRKLLRGHYNPTTKRRRRPNLQWFRLSEPRAGRKAGERILVCTKCMKAFSKQRV